MLSALLSPIYPLGLGFRLTWAVFLSFHITSKHGSASSSATLGDTIRGHDEKSTSIHLD